MSWQTNMASENQRFRGLWAEHGGDYLYGDWLPLPPPAEETYSLTMDSVDRRIDDMFTKFSAGNLEGVGPIITQLNGSHRTLNDFTENADGLLGHLDGWAGETAERFDHYIREMKSAVDHKKNCLQAAKETIRSYDALLEEYYRAINELIRNTDSALADVAEANEAVQWQFTFGVAVAAVAVVGAGVATGGLAWGAAIGALTAGVATSSTAYIGGEEEGEVIVSMVEYGEEIIKDAEAAARNIRNACFEITTYLTTYNGSRPDDEPYGDGRTTDLEEIRPNRPDLITDEEFDREEFRPEDATGGDVADVSRDDLVQNPERDGDDPRDYELRDPTGEQSPAIPTPADPEPDLPGQGIHPEPADPVPTPDFYPEQGAPEPEQPEPIEGYIPPTT